MDFDLCSQESFVASVSSILSEKAFLREFQRQFDFRDLILQVQRSHPDWDRTQFEYILSALGASKATPPNGSANEGATGVQPLVAQVKELFPYLETEFIEVNPLDSSDLLDYLQRLRTESCRTVPCTVLELLNLFFDLHVTLSLTASRHA